MARCRTAELGGHAQICANGHLQGVWYNSCRHRSCPSCAWIGSERWLEQKQKLLLPTAHHHVIFTLPHEFLSLWRWNRKAMADLLFHAARDTLLELLADERYLGGRPGIVMALHTWSSSLVLHPHVHCLVTAGGIDRSGCWRTPKRSIFLPGRVVAALFKGKVQVPSSVRSNRTPSACLRTLRSRHGSVRLGIEQFLDRLFEHVPDVGMHVVRSCGLYHRSQRAVLESCRSGFATVSSTLSSTKATASIPAPNPPLPGATCPVCGASIVRVPIPRGGAPPFFAVSRAA